MRKKNLLWMFFALTLIISIVPVGISSGSSETFLYVDPPLKVDTSLVPSANFSIDIAITNVINLTGYEFKLGYDTSILTATGITIGPFIYPYKIWTEEIKDAEGYVKYAASLPPKIPPYLGVSGSGVLATIDFTVDDVGESVLDLYGIKLTGYNGHTSYPIYPEVNDGYFSNTGVCTPVAVFTFEPKKPVAGKSVTFDASASYDPDGTIVSYEWNFGDGHLMTETDPITTHIYASNGTYSVNLTVTDDGGVADTAAKNVTVDLRDIAIAEIKVDPTEIPTGQSAAINITILNNGTLREWFNVTAYYENATAKYPIWYNETANQKAFRLEGLALRPGENMSVIFNWTTTDIIGTRIYRISANACLVDYDGRFIPDESDLHLTNNALGVDVTVKAPHDIAVIAIEPSKKAAIIGESLSINVTVQNQGTSTETCNVTAYYASSIIDTYTDVSLDADTSKTLVFTWKTTEVAEDEYTISATATIVIGEDDTADNEIIYDGKVTLSKQAIHDIAVTKVKANPTSAIVGAPVSINVTVDNVGTENETFNVILYYDGNVIGAETVINLASGAEKTVTFSWDTLGVPAGSYTIKAEVPPVPQETDTADNFSTDTVALTVKIIDHIKVVAGAQFRIVIESNSDVSDLTFNQTEKELSFKVTGELATGFCNVTVPKDLLDAPPNQWVVLVDGESVTPSVGYNATHTFLYFTFNLSTRNIQIIGTAAATKPIASFGILPTDPIIGELVTFDASASYDPDGTITSYKWSFGDGTIITVADPVITHIYSSAGTYTVTLTAKDNNGLSSEPAQKPITVLQPPTANFTYSPETPIVGEALTFNATTSYDPDGEIVSYKWDFGDGTITTVADPVITHIYTAPGTYSVNLTVTDNDELTDTTASYVIVLVHDITVTSVILLPTTVTVGESVSISVTVDNEGNFSETFDVTVYYNENTLDTQTGITLSAGANTTLEFIWDTTNVPPSNYTISAKASVVPNETDTTNNTYIDGTVKVKETQTTAPAILYVAAAVAIVIIIATIVIYFVRFKKS